jgi:hypothetical protein
LLEELVGELDCNCLELELEEQIGGGKFKFSWQIQTICKFCRGHSENCVKRQPFWKRFGHFGNCDLSRKPFWKRVDHFGFFRQPFWKF